MVYCSQFESDLLKTNEDIASQSCAILQTFVWWGVGGHKLDPYNTNIRKLSLLCQAMYYRSFQWCQRIFPNLSMSKVEKTVQGLQQLITRNYLTIIPRA